MISKQIILLAAMTLAIVSCKKVNLVEVSASLPGSSQKSGIFTTSAIGITQQEIAVNSALDVLGPGSVNGFKYTFWGPANWEVGSAIATLGKELSTGNRDVAVVNTYVAVIKQIVNNSANQMIVTGGLEHRESLGAYFGMALGWRQGDIKALFTSAEQNKILLTMKAGLVASAFVMANYTPTGVVRPTPKVCMRGNPNQYDSPNYAEGYAGTFLAALAVIGKGNIYSFLNNYDHGTFTSELVAAGLTRISTSFSTLFNVTAGGIVYDASTIAKKEALVESYVRYIDNNDNASKPFFRGVKLSDITADPLNLYINLNTDCFNNIATEGDYVGSLGMANELNGSDGGGVRSSIFYSTAGLINDVYNRYLVQDYGYWASSTQTGAKANIDLLLKVGFSDIASKSWNGYWSYKLGIYTHDRMVPYETGESWWQRTYNMAHSMGIVKEYYMNDSFDDANYTAYPSWTATDGAWSFTTPVTFTGYVPIKPDTVIKTSVADLRSRLIAPYVGTNYDVTVQCKVNSFGTLSNSPQIGLIGRYTDANNFYIMKYNYATNNCEIISVQNNIWTTLNTSGTITLNTGTLYILRASFDGNQLKFYINNVLKASATNNSFTSGKPGLFSRYTEVMYDDVFVNKATLN